MFRKGAKGLTFYTIFYFILIFQTIHVILFYISGKTLSNAKMIFTKHRPLNVVTELKKISPKYAK